MVSAEKRAFGKVVQLGTDARYTARLEELVYTRLRDRITEILDRDDLSRRKLATRARLNAATLNDFLSGQTQQLSLGRVVAVAVGLGVTVDHLLGPSAGESLAEQARSETTASTA